MHEVPKHNLGSDIGANTDLNQAGFNPVDLTTYLSHNPNADADDILTNIAANRISVTTTDFSNILGLCSELQDNNNYNTAIRYGKILLQLTNNSLPDNNLDYKPIIHTILAGCYNKTNFFASAAEHARQAIDLIQDYLNDSNYPELMLINLTAYQQIIYANIQLEDFDTALQYNDQFFEHASHNSFAALTVQACEFYMMIKNTTDKTNELVADATRTYQALQHMNKVDSEIAFAYTRLSTICHSIGLKNETLLLANQAQQAYDDSEINEPELQIEILEQLSAANHATKNFQDAYDYLANAYEIYQQSDGVAFELLTTISYVERLIDIKLAMGKTEEALSERQALVNSLLATYPEQVVLIATSRYKLANIHMQSSNFQVAYELITQVCQDLTKFLPSPVNQLLTGQLSYADAVDQIDALKQDLADSPYVSNLFHLASKAAIEAATLAALLNSDDALHEMEESIYRSIQSLLPDENPVTQCYLDVLIIESYKKRDLIPQAVELCEAAIKKYPDTFYNKAELYLQLAEIAIYDEQTWQTAFQHIKKALPIFNQDPEFKQSMAYARVLQLQAKHAFLLYKLESNERLLDSSINKLNQSLEVCKQNYTSEGMIALKSHYFLAELYKLKGLEDTAKLHQARAKTLSAIIDVNNGFFMQDKWFGDSTEL